MSWKTKPLTVSVYLEDDNPVFGESATHVSVDDDAGGEFIILTQSTDDGDMKLKFDIEELRLVLEVAENLMKGTD